MTLQVQDPDSLCDALRQHFSQQETVEITATIGAYNVVSGFLEALQIHSDDERYPSRAPYPPLYHPITILLTPTAPFRAASNQHRTLRAACPACCSAHPLSIGPRHAA